LRRTERGWTGVAACDPRSYDLPDFRTLGDGPPLALAGCAAGRADGPRVPRGPGECGLRVARRSFRCRSGAGKPASELGKRVVGLPGIEPGTSALSG